MVALCGGGRGGGEGRSEVKGEERAGFSDKDWVVWYLVGGVGVVGIGMVVWIVRLVVCFLRGGWWMGLRGRWFGRGIVGEGVGGFLRRGESSSGGGRGKGEWDVKAM